MLEGHITEMPKDIKNNSSDIKDNSDFYSRVKALHDSKVSDDKEKYFNTAYAKIEEELGENGKFVCRIDEYDVYDEDITNELIDKLIDDGFKAEYDNTAGEIVVKLR